MAQGYNDKLDESLGMKDGPEDTKDQSMADRRDESRGAKGPDIDALISHYEEGLSLLKEHKASMGGGDELIESVGAAEVLPDGDVLAEGAAIEEPMPGDADIAALLDAELGAGPPGPGLPGEEEEEAFDLNALTAAAAKNALA